jgi:hypothetical protein
VAPTILDQRKFSSRGSAETLLEKLYFSENLKKIAEIYSGTLFLHNTFISETYFLSMKRFRKAAYKLEALKTIY